MELFLLTIPEVARGLPSRFSLGLDMSLESRMSFPVFLTKSLLKNHAVPVAVLCALAGFSVSGQDHSPFCHDVSWRLASGQVSVAALVLISLDVAGNILLVTVTDPLDEGGILLSS